jgi:hypothetical protein
VTVMDAHLLLCKSQVAANYFAKWYGKPGSMDPAFNKFLDVGWLQVQQATSIEGVRHALHYTGSIMRASPIMLPSLRSDNSLVEVFDYQARTLFSAKKIDDFMDVEAKVMTLSKNRFSRSYVPQRKMAALSFSIAQAVDLAKKFIDRKITNLGSNKVANATNSGESLSNRSSKLVDRFGLKGLRLVAGSSLQQAQWLTIIEQQMADASRTLSIPETMFGLHGTLTVQAGPVPKQSECYASYNNFQRIIRCKPETGFRSMIHEWIHALDHHVGAAVTGDWYQMASNTTEYADKTHVLYPAFLEIKKSVHSMISTAHWDVVQNLKNSLASSLLDAMWSVYFGDSWALMDDECRHKLCNVENNDYLVSELVRDLSTNTANEATMRWLVACLDARAKEYPDLQKQSRLDEASMFQRLQKSADIIHFVTSPSYQPSKLLDECLLLDDRNNEFYDSKASEIWARHWENLDLSPIACAIKSAVSTTPTKDCSSATVLRDVIGYVVDRGAERIPREGEKAKDEPVVSEGMSF